MRFLTTSILAFWSVSLMASSQEYRVYNFQPAESATCQQAAETTLQRFATAAQVSAEQALCEYDSWSETVTLRMKYSAAESVPTVNNYRLTSYEKRGFYKTPERCERYLDYEVRNFRSQTGLEPFLVFCTFNKLDSEFPWYVQIHAVGDSGRKHHLASWSSGRPYGDSFQQLAGEIKTNLERLGYFLNNLRWRNSSTLGSATLSLYADSDVERISFHSTVLASIPGLDTCTAERDKLRQNLAQEKESLVMITAYCDSYYSSPVRFNLRLAYVPKYFLHLITSNESFENMLACQSQLPTLEARFRKFYGEKFVTAVCGYRPHGFRDKFRVNILHR